MSITSKCLFQYARDIHSSGVDEVHHRACVGRAYYAAYHEAKSWHDHVLPKRGQEPAPDKRYGSHAHLIHQLEHPSQECSEDQQAISIAVGERMKHLRAKRVTADYSLDESVTKKDASDACIEAAQLMSRLVGAQKKRGKK